MSARGMRVTACAVVLAVSAVAAAVAQSAPPEAPSNEFNPPPCTGTLFTDVTCSGLFDAWIEQYADDHITGGCGGGLYCPNSPVTRGQMAVFVEKAMRGTAGWSPGDLGNFNTGLGRGALLSNTTAGFNTAIGDQALAAQSFDAGGSGWSSRNTAVGVAALAFNQPTSASNGVDNTAMGVTALGSNSTGHSNTAVGSTALAFSDTGFLNTAVGFNAGSRFDPVTGYAGSEVDLVANQSGDYNTFIGSAGATAQVDNCTAVGMDAYCDATNQVRLGNFFVTSIGGKVAWSTLSDGRAKTDVRDLDWGLDLVMALRPVSYRYKGGNGRADMGFVAQDVEALLGDGYNVVDAAGDSDRTLSLRYSELIAPLVKAVQQQQDQLDRQSLEIERLRERLAAVAQPPSAPQ